MRGNKANKNQSKAKVRGNKERTKSKPREHGAGQYTEAKNEPTGIVRRRKAKSIATCGLPVRVKQRTKENQRPPYGAISRTEKIKTQGHRVARYGERNVKRTATVRCSTGEREKKTVIPPHRRAGQLSERQTSRWPPCDEIERTKK